MTQGTTAALATILGPQKPYIASEVEARVFTVSGFDFSREFKVGDYSHNYRNISFREGSWARSHLSGMAENVASAKVIADKYVTGCPGVADAIKAAFDKWAQSHIGHWLNYIGGHSGQASAMITGPSNFPVRRQEKKWRAGDRRYELIEAHRAAISKRLKRIAYPHGAPGEAIRSSNPDAPELLRKRIQKLKDNHEYMKRCNRVIKQATKLDEGARVSFVMERLGISEHDAQQLLKPAYTGRVFAYGSFELSNNLANIKRLETRLQSIEAAKARGDRDHDIDGLDLKLSENTDAMRIQFAFPGKPSDEARKVLKSNGFRWAPSQGAWQRHLNNAGRDAARRVIAGLKQLQE